MMLGLSLALPAVRRAGGLAFAAPAIGTTYTLTSIGIGAGGVGTYLFKGTLDAVSTGTAQVFFQIDSGAATNRFLVQAAAGSAIHQISRTTASVAATTNGGAIAAATLFRHGMTIDGAGNAAASHDGATAITVAGGPTSGLTTLRFGAGVAGGAPMVGSIALIRVLPGVALTAAELEDAVLAL
jgi:hypothetical protein